MKQILTFKWGTRYGPEYVNRIYGMVSRNVTSPFTVHCFTDDRSGIRSEVVCHDLPELGCQYPENVPGKWKKTAMWGADLDGLSGPALFIDLDTVIVDNIDEFFEYGNEKDVIVARNWLKPFQRLGQTTLFRYYIGAQPYMLEDFQKDPQGLADKYRFEQHYVTKHLKAGVKFWPDRWVRHYRVHCLGNYFRRYLLPAKIPKSARIIAFPGHPNPEDAIVGKWTDFEPVTRWQHIKNTFSPAKRVRKSWVKHLRSFQLPCKWVAEHWRE